MKRGACVEAAEVERRINVPQSYRLVRRDARAERTVVRLPNGATFGGDEIALCAGPCGVESAEQLERTARAIAGSGANVLRGGAYKPRTSPYSFQGLGEEALRLLRDCADRYGLGVVTEVVDPRGVEQVASYADMLQIGARNMQNFALLREAGVVPLLEELTHLPVIVDPSHAIGIARLVPALAVASVAAGAHGLLVEVHPEPSRALSDGAQSLDFDQFDALVRRLGPVAALSGRRLPSRLKIGEREETGFGGAVQQQRR